MKITLIRTGGFIPMVKKAEAEVDWTEEEIDELINNIAVEENEPGLKRDATTYALNSNAGTFPIDWEKIPAKYKSTFEEMKDNLKMI